MRGSARAGGPRGVVLLALAMVAWGCARRMPPSGGPPDVTAPKLIASVPDSGAARVGRRDPIGLTFSEPMEPRSTSDAVSIVPYVPIKQRRWSGRTLTVVLAESLKANQTYALTVGGGARDHHGNPMSSGATVPFSTADSFPPGVIAGHLQGRGVSVIGAYLWCYAGARTPDSTARDFDALGLADDYGDFRVLGLYVPGTYRLWAFIDLNRNRSFEPATDLLVPVDTTFELTPAAPTATGLEITLTNPRAPGRVGGAVLDSLAGSARSRIVAVSDVDEHNVVDVACNNDRAFKFELSPGKWRLRGYRDVNGNGRWEQVTEPASDAYPIEVNATQEITGVRLVVVGLAPKP